MASGTADLPPIKELLNKTFATFNQSILQLIILTFVGVAIRVGLGMVVGILTFFLFRSAVGSFNATDPVALLNSIKQLSIPGALLGIIFGIAFFVIGLAFSIASILVVANASKRMSWNSALSASWSLVLPLFLISIVVGFLQIGSAGLLFLPGLLVALFLLFVPYEVILANKRGIAAIKSSVNLVSQYFGEILIRIIVLALLYLLVVIFIPNLISRIDPASGLILFFLRIILGAAIGWLGLCYVINIYQQVKERANEAKPTSMWWLWLAAILGWLIIIGGIVLGAKSIKSGVLERLMQTAPARRGSPNLRVPDSACNRFTISEPDELKSDNCYTFADYSALVSAMTKYKFAQTRYAQMDALSKTACAQGQASCQTYSQNAADAAAEMEKYKAEALLIIGRGKPVGTSI